MAKGKTRGKGITSRPSRAKTEQKSAAPRKLPPAREQGGIRLSNPSAEFLYGRNPVLESLRAGRRKFYRLILAEGVRDTYPIDEIISLAARKGLYPLYFPREKLDETIPDGHHQGVLLETSPYPYALLEEIIGKAPEHPLPVVLVLDLLQDPQNVGNLLRTAEAVGVAGVVIQERRAVGVTPAVVKTSAGAVEHLLVAQVTNLNRALEGLKEAGLWAMGLEKAPEAVDIFEADLKMPIALVIGSEGKGIRPSVREKCDLLLKLPMEGRVSSLNAAVAGSIALYQIYYQHKRCLPQG